MIGNVCRTELQVVVKRRFIRGCKGRKELSSGRGRRP